MEDNNNLNNIFRDRFNTDDIPKEKWNTPDHEVWSNIERTLPKKEEKSSKSTLIPFLLSLALLSFMFLGYKYFEKAQKVMGLEILLKECSESKEIPLNNFSAQNSIPQTSNKQNSTPQNSIVKNGKSSKSSFEDSQVIKSPSLVAKGSTNIQLSNLNKIENIMGDVKISSSNVNILSNFGTSDPNLNKDGDNKVISINSERELNEENKFEKGRVLKITPLNQMELIMLTSSKNRFLIDFPNINSPMIIPSKKTSGPWMVGVSSGYIQWVDHKKGRLNNPLSELLLDENTSSSFNLQLNFKKVLHPKLSLNLGLGTYSRTQSSTYRLSLPYSTANETSHGNEFHNYFEHSLPTSLGNINTNLTLARSISSNVTNNENVDLDFSLSNKIHAINVPVTFIYYPMNSGQGLYFETGINTEFIYQQKLTNVTTNSFHSQVDDRDMKVAFDRKQIEQINFSIPLGIGYSKKIGKDISIDFSANYGFGLNNVHMHEGFTHKIDRITSQISVFKSL
jgi:hypothetical protein